MDEVPHDNLKALIIMGACSVALIDLRRKSLDALGLKGACCAIDIRPAYQGRLLRDP